MANPFSMRFGAPAGRKLVWLVLILLLSGPAGAKTRTAKRRQVQPAIGIAGEMLSVHNQVRASVNLPPLQWSNALAEYSQKWANTLLDRNRTAHNPDSPYGENILVAGTGATPSMIIKEWAAESGDYSYRTNACSTDCGHYTQLVWRNTRKVGCGVARGARREIWVCSYDPPGNYSNEWPY